MQGERKCLGTSVIGDGHGRPAPQLAAVDQVLGIRYAVERTHIGVQVQLNPLFRRMVHAYFLFGLDDGGRFQDALLLVGVKANLALYDQVHAGLDGRDDVPGLLLGHKLGHADGVGTVGDVKGDLHPFFSALLAGNLAVIDKKYIALNGDAVKLP